MTLSSPRIMTRGMTLYFTRIVSAPIKKRCFVDPLICEIVGNWSKIVARNWARDVIA